MYKKGLYMLFTCEHFKQDFLCVNIVSANILKQREHLAYLYCNEIGETL